MKKSGEHVRVNFGQSPFVFDIDGMMSASSNFPYPQASFGSIGSDLSLAVSNISGSQEQLQPSNSGAAVAASLELLDESESDDEPPPLVTPSPPRSTNNGAVPNGTWQAERTGSAAINFVFNVRAPVIENPPRSARTILLLQTLERHSRRRTLNNTERHIIRIAAGIDEHRASLLASTSPVRAIHWSRITASERALDDLGDRISAELFPTLAAIGFPMEPEEEARRGWVSNSGEPVTVMANGLPAEIARNRAAMERFRGLENDIRADNSLRPGHRIPNFNQHPGARALGDDSPETSPLSPLLPRREPLPKPRDVNTMTDFEKQQERKQIRQQIEMTSTVKLAPPLSETDLIQSLVCLREFYSIALRLADTFSQVLQFLTHDGYVETARAFAEEVHSEKKALSLDPNAIIEGVDVKEDEDAGHRQRRIIVVCADSNADLETGIRKAVLEGDIEKALKYTHAFYPNVLKDNEHVSFRLKCRRYELQSRFSPA